MSTHWTPLLQKHPFPIITVREGGGGVRNARNDLFHVELWRDCGPRQSLLGILGQEVYECQAKWRGVGQRERELMGHAIEAHIASSMDGFHLDAYEAAEAAGMVQGYAGLFTSFDDALQGLQDRRVRAAEWVFGRRDFFAHWREVLA